MPNRILRDWTSSKKVNRLSADAERLFTRLIMKADDYGRFHADPVMIKSLCFPRNEAVTTKIIQKLLPELSELTTIYEVDGEKFLEIKNFDQRLRIKKEKFPKPVNNNKNEDDSQMTVTCQSDDGQMTAGCLPETKRSRNEVEVEVETEVETETNSRKSGKKSPSLLFRESVFFDKEKFIAELESSPPPYCNANAEHYYEAALNWSDSNHAKKADWIATVKNWIRRAVEEGTFKTKFSQPTPIQKNGTFKDKAQRVTDHNVDQLSRLVGGSEGA